MTSDTGFVTTTTTSTSNIDPQAMQAMLVFFGVIWLIAIVVAIVSLVFMWKMFTKAGKPGWAAIVPIYNQVVTLQIIGRPVWWVVLMFIPFVNLWIWVVVLADLAKAYSRSVGFSVVLFFFTVIGYGVLAFSKKSIYRGPIAEGYNGFMPVSDDYAASHSSNTTPGASGFGQAQPGAATAPNPFAGQGVPVSPYTGQPIDVPTVQPSGPADATTPAPTQPQSNQSVDNSGSDTSGQSGQNPTA